MRISICVFDAYGTIFDVASAARRLAAEPGHEALAEVLPRVSDLWRFKQLQYSWLRSAAGIHCDFWTLTTQALDHALEAEGLDDPALRARLLDLYRKIDAYPEVPAMLAGLKAQGINRAILSNADPAMLGAAIDAAGLTTQFDAVLSAESVGVFKPNPKIYDFVCQSFGVPRRAVLFVSGNGWDAWAGTAFGFRTVWANRRGEPVDRLSVAPDHIVSDLSAVPAIAAGIG